MRSWLAVGAVCVALAGCSGGSDAPSSAAGPCRPFGTSRAADIVQFGPAPTVTGAAAVDTGERTVPLDRPVHVVAIATADRPVLLAVEVGRGNGLWTALDAYSHRVTHYPLRSFVADDVEDADISKATGCLS